MYACVLLGRKRKPLSPDDRIDLYGHSRLSYSCTAAVLSSQCPFDRLRSLESRRLISLYARVSKAARRDSLGSEPADSIAPLFSPLFEITVASVRSVTLSMFLISRIFLIESYRSERRMDRSDRLSQAQTCGL